MKRTDYQKPTMCIVEMKHRSHILAGSDRSMSVSSSRNGYGAATTDTWGDEEEE